VDHWGIEPDVILVGKGVASGYAPLGGLLVNQRIVETIERGSGVFLHGFTYNAHPVSAAAGVAVLDYIAENNLFERVSTAGRELREALEPLARLSVVGDIRGMGLLQGIEIVRDPETREAFPPEAHIAKRIAEDAMEAGVVTYPMQGSVDGRRGDHILLAPPFTITSQQIQMIAGALGRALGELESAHRPGAGGSPVANSTR